MKSTMQLQTVRGNLKNFNDYYSVFISLSTENNLEYLGYPFTDNDSPDSSEIQNYQIFNSICDNTSILKEAANLDWVYHNIVQSFKNNTNHLIAKLILNRTTRHKFGNHNSSLVVLESFMNLILHYEKPLGNRMFSENEVTWRDFNAN